MCKEVNCIRLLSSQAERKRRVHEESPPAKRRIIISSQKLALFIFWPRARNQLHSICLAQPNMLLCSLWLRERIFSFSSKMHICAVVKT